MATALKEDVDSRKENTSITDDSADDFEVVSEAQFIDGLSIISEYRSRGDNGEEMSHEQVVDSPIIDPLAAFEMIHSEHRLLKDELEAQNDMLRQRLDASEEQERQKTEEIDTLKQNLETVSLELSESRAQLSDMERQIKYFKESSEKADMLTAKLLEAEDVMKSQNDMVQKMQRDGYNGVPTSPVLMELSSDKNLMADLAQKNQQIKRFEGTLATLESALGAMNGERLKAAEQAGRLESMNRELQGLITDLQSQAEADKAKTEMDKAEWDAIRTDLEQQIQILSDRVIAFENQFSGQSMTQPSTVTGITTGENNVGQAAETPTLRHRDAPSPRPSGAEWVHCPRCHLPMAAAGPHPCPAIIDCLD